MIELTRGYYWANVNKAFKQNPEHPDRRRQKTSRQMLLPSQFMKALRKAGRKRQNKGYIDFTIGIEGFKTAIGIVHPKDKYEDEMEQNVVFGRLDKKNEKNTFYLDLENQTTWDKEWKVQQSEIENN